MFSVDTLLSADMQVIHAYDLSSLQVNAAKDLIRSDKVRSGFKGVREICDGQYQATCFTSPCVHNNLGATFGSREEAAQAYLRHWENNHPEELEKERASRPPPSVHEHVVLIRSDKSQTGYKGVRLNGGRYQAQCETPPCLHYYLGNFGTPEEAAHAYLQHYQKEHPEELKNERVPRPVLLPVQEHLLIRSDQGSTGFKGVYPDKSMGRYQAACTTAPCRSNYLGSFGTPEKAAQLYLQHQQQAHSHHPAHSHHFQKEHQEELKKDRAPPLQVQEHLLIRPDRGQTGYMGVAAHHGRYQQHCEQEHPEKANLQHQQEEQSERAGQTGSVLGQTGFKGLHLHSNGRDMAGTRHVLIRSDTSQTGYKGVYPSKDRYQAMCNTSPCHKNHLGNFGTPEQGARAYLQHWEVEHPEEQVLKEQVSLNKVIQPSTKLYSQEHLFQLEMEATIKRVMESMLSRVERHVEIEAMVPLPLVENHRLIRTTPKFQVQHGGRIWCSNLVMFKSGEGLPSSAAGLGWSSHTAPLQQHLLIRSDQGSTGYKGVYPTNYKGVTRYQAKCETSPCRSNNLGTFGTSEEAAQAYLQHRQLLHKHLTQELFRSDKSVGGYKGVKQDKGRYQAQCNTSPCRSNHLGMFGTSEEAAQAYLQHWEKKHPEELKKERALYAPPTVLPEVQEHLLIRSDQNSTGFKGVYPDRGRYKAQRGVSNHLGSFGTPEEAAQAYLQHQEKDHEEEPKNEEQRRFSVPKRDQPERQSKRAHIPLSEKLAQMATELEDEPYSPRWPGVLEHLLLRCNPQVQEHLLLRDKSKSGFKGVFAHTNARYRVACSSAGCSSEPAQKAQGRDYSSSENHLGIYNTREWAAQVYLQHWQDDHPEELELMRQQPQAEERLPVRSRQSFTRREREDPIPENLDVKVDKDVLVLMDTMLGMIHNGIEKLRTPVETRLLIRSDKSSTGFKGVRPKQGRYQTQCTTSPCHNNHLGNFGTPEEAAQAYLQHWETWHLDELDKHPTGFKGVRRSKGRFEARCDKACTYVPCLHPYNWLGCFDSPEEASEKYLQHKSVHEIANRLKEQRELESHRATQATQVRATEQYISEHYRSSTDLSGQQTSAELQRFLMLPAAAHAAMVKPGRPQGIVPQAQGAHGFAFAEGEDARDEHGQRRILVPVAAGPPVLVSLKKGRSSSSADIPHDFEGVYVYRYSKRDSAGIPPFFRADCLKCRRQLGYWELPEDAAACIAAHSFQNALECEAAQKETKDRATKVAALFTSRVSAAATAAAAAAAAAAVVAPSPPRVCINPPQRDGLLHTEEDLVGLVGGGGGAGGGGGGRGSGGKEDLLGVEPAAARPPPSSDPHATAAQPGVATSLEGGAGTAESGLKFIVAVQPAHKPSLLLSDAPKNQGRTPRLFADIELTAAQFGQPGMCYDSMVAQVKTKFADVLQVGEFCMSYIPPDPEAGSEAGLGGALKKRRRTPKAQAEGGGGAKRRATPGTRVILVTENIHKIRSDSSMSPVFDAELDGAAGTIVSEPVLHSNWYSVVLEKNGQALKLRSSSFRVDSGDGSPTIVEKKRSFEESDGAVAQQNKNKNKKSATLLPSSTTAVDTDTPPKVLHSVLPSSATPGQASVVLDLVSQVVSLLDTDSPSGFADGFFFVLEYRDEEQECTLLQLEVRGAFPAAAAATAAGGGEGENWEAAKSREGMQRWKTVPEGQPGGERTVSALDCAVVVGAYSVLGDSCEDPDLDEFYVPLSNGKLSGKLSGIASKEAQAAAVVAPKAAQAAAVVAPKEVTDDVLPAGTPRDASGKVAPVHFVALTNRKDHGHDACAREVLHNSFNWLDYFASQMTQLQVRGQPAFLLTEISKAEQMRGLKGARIEGIPSAAFAGVTKRVLGTDADADRTQPAKRPCLGRHPPPPSPELLPIHELLPIQPELLIRSDKGKTGFQGIRPHLDRFQATCYKSPCRKNHLGSFDTSEEAAQMYLQHYQGEHPAELKKDDEQEARRAALEHRLALAQDAVRELGLVEEPRGQEAPPH